jgi:cytosine/adenosine deaminase-related metal-dependent hydrolase
MVSSQSLITLPLEGQEVSATLMNMYHDIQDKEGRRSRIRALNIFWYLGSDGTTCAGYHEHVRKTYSDAFFKNLNHRWTLLTFFVPLQDSATGFDDPYAELTALKDAEAFIQMLVPKLLTEP